MNFNNEGMIQGYRHLEEGDVVKACEIWLDMWKEIRNFAQSQQIKSIEELDRDIESFESLVNWVQDIEMELENAALVDSVYYKSRIEYCEEFVQVLPESDPFIVMSMSTATAETYFEVGEEVKSGVLFEQITKSFTGTVWPYVKWGDTQWLSAAKMSGVTLNDLKKAEEIYLKGKPVMDLEDYQLLEDRLKEVREYINKAENMQ